MALNDERGYQYHAGIHGLPLPIGCDNAHGTAYFLPWHRAYLYFFERSLRDRVADAMLTWWDWRRTPATPGLPAAFTDRTGADGKPNPLASSSIARVALEQGRRQGMNVPARTQRRPRPASSLPSAQNVERVLQLSDFLDFSMQMEDLHGNIHGWVGGHMAMVPYAAYDPIFWAHHTMIDRLWRLWQLRHPNALPPASIIDRALPPFRMTVRQTLDVTALGYDYAAATRSVDFQ
ncbi:MAG: tyrosinase family protein [Gaiellaceae bacterium]